MTSIVDNRIFVNPDNKIYLNTNKTLDFKRTTYDEPMNTEIPATNQEIYYEICQDSHKCRQQQMTNSRMYNYNKINNRT